MHKGVGDGSALALESTSYKLWLFRGFGPANGERETR